MNTLDAEPFPLQPLGTLLAVRPDPIPQKIRQIVIPDASRTSTFRGTVVAVGPGWILPSGGRVTNECQVGDRVLMGKRCGDEFFIDGERILLIPEDHVWSRLSEENPGT